MIPILLIFSHTLSTQLFFYPLLLIGGILTSPFEKLKIKFPLSGSNLYFVCFYALFLITIVLMDLIRGASLELIVFNLRFFYGIGFVFLCFKLVNNLHIGRSFFWIFVLFSLYESFTLNILEVHPFYWNYSGFDIDFLMERVMQDRFNSILGPAMNSSISGTIYVVMFFIMMKNRLINQSSTKISDNILIFLLFLCILLSSSTVAYGIFFIGVLTNLNLIIQWANKNIKIVGLILITTIIFSLIFPVFNSLSFEPVTRVLYHKYYSFTVSYTWTETLFGWNSLQNYHSSNFGGDFMYLHQFILNGMLTSVLFIFILFKLTPKHNRVYLLLGVISTFHYGALYALLGQLFFGAIIANRLRI